MCQVDRKTEKLKQPLTVYKVAPLGKSEWIPKAREALFEHGATSPMFSNPGRVLRYLAGTRVRSPSGPGIFAYLTKDTSITTNWWLELRIPRGAIIRRGSLYGVPIVCASSVHVVGPA